MSKRPKIIAVDFDGVIVKNKFPEIGEINIGIVQKLKIESKKGTIIILWSCRSGEYEAEMIAFCLENDIPFHCANRNWPGLDFETSRKIYADEYIDDRAVKV